MDFYTILKFLIPRQLSKFVNYLRKFDNPALGLLWKHCWDDITQREGGVMVTLLWHCLLMSQRQIEKAESAIFGGAEFNYVNVN